MSRKQFVPHTGSHEKRTTRTEQKAELAKQREEYEKQKAEFEAAQAEQQQEIAMPEPTEEDKQQLKRLAIYSIIGLFALLALMFYFFVIRE